MENKKKVLYFTIEKEEKDDRLTGFKTVTVYDMVNNKPEMLASIDCSNEDSSTDAIQDYLNNNGYGDDEFELIQL